MSLIVDEWEYLAQGGRHVVFRYRGGGTVWKNKVVRFLKCTGRSQEEDIQEVTGTIEWLRKDMVPMVKDAIDVPRYIAVSREVTIEFSRLCGCKLAAAADYMPDYTACDILVEIKPKKGVLFTSNSWDDRGNYLPSGDPLRKLCCKHCMQQSLKLGKGKINTISSFCPMQLFHGGIENAFQGMFAVPQNSLLLRKNGVLVDPTTIGIVERHDITSQAQEALEQSGILNTLSEIQRIIPLDIETIHQARNRGSLEITYSTSERTTCLASSMRLGSLKPPVYEDEDISMPINTTTLPMSQVLERYFISRSAQDTSIMIQLHRGCNSSVKIVDLDKKPPRKYDLWVGQDKNLVSVFRASLP